ncbi:MAG: tetratricopeptide repeat protein [Saprospiraceae bacterium]|nr:tetratricopeptide repeat protein [Saprospiraceae bacterium]
MQTAKEIRKFCETGLHDPNISAEEAAKLHVELGGSFITSGKFEEAKTAFLDAIHHNPNFAEAFSNLSHVFAREGDFDKAEEYGAKAHELNSESHELNWLLAREGKRMTEKLKKHPIPTLFYKRGLLFDFQGFFDKAKEDYKKAVEIDPDFFDAYKKLGDVYLKLGMIEEAVQSYDEVSDRVHDYKFDEENFLFMVKKWEHFIKKIELNPRAADCAQLATFFVSQKTEPTLQKARKYFKKALELDPNHLVANEGLQEVELLLEGKGIIEDDEHIGPSPQVPNILRHPTSIATSELRTGGFKPKIKYAQISDPNQVGVVLSISPDVGSVLPHGQEKVVTITIGHLGLPLEAIEGIGPKNREKLLNHGVKDLQDLISNPDVGDEIDGLSAESTRKWSSMATWMFVLPEHIDGNAAELAVVGLGLDSPEDAYEMFLGKPLEEIREFIKNACIKVKLPNDYVKNNLDTLSHLVYNIY